MTQEAERPDRVQARVDCTLQGTSRQLVGSIHQDIEYFNELPSIEQGSRGKVIYHQGHARMVRVGYGEPDELEWDDHVAIYLMGAVIQVYRNGQLCFVVTQKWSEYTLKCDLLINGEIYSLWQISQKAIGDLLFVYQS